MKVEGTSLLSVLLVGVLDYEVRISVVEGIGDFSRVIYLACRVLSTVLVAMEVRRICICVRRNMYFVIILWKPEES